MNLVQDNLLQSRNYPSGRRQRNMERLYQCEIKKL